MAYDHGWMVTINIYFLQIVQWLNTMRLGDGGFISTVDTIVAMEALVMRKLFLLIFIFFFYLPNNTNKWKMLKFIYRVFTITFWFY